MLADIIRTTELASKAGMTYGAYVAEYGISEIQPKPKAKKGKTCACGADISNMHCNTIYCDVCAAERINTAKARQQKKSNYGKQSYKTYKQKEQAI